LEDDNQKNRKKVEGTIVLCAVDMFVEAKEYFCSLA
jgi:hypothetical protein